MAGDFGNTVKLAPGLPREMLLRQSEPLRIGEESPESGEKFTDVFARMVDSVNEAQVASGEIQDAFLAGEPVELHQVMIEAEKAGIATDLLLEIRNRLVDGINEIMRMPV